MKLRAAKLGARSRNPERSLRGIWQFEMGVMVFEQATIKIENERSFGELKSALDQIFAPDLIAKYLKKLSGQNIRIRDWDAILAAGSIDVIAGSRLGAARALYQSLTVSDQAQMRELYLSKIEQVDQALRARFSKLYRYY
ncbi:MAG: hypothetical protein WAQ52_05750 [Terriglobales bacterium]